MENKPRWSGLLNFLELVMHMAGLNVLFLAFSIPLITGGAARTALLSGLRAMIKKEPCYRAFFKAFKAGFGRATAAWILMLLPTAPVVFNTVTMLYYQLDGSLPWLILSILISVVLLSILYMLFLFYSRFECTLWQMFRFSAHLVLSWPIRSLLVTVLMILPFVLLTWASTLFLVLGVLWVFFYFSLAGVCAIWLMNVPFARFARQTLGWPGPEKTQNAEKLDMQQIKEVEE